MTKATPATQARTRQLRDNLSDMIDQLEHVRGEVEQIHKPQPDHTQRTFQLEAALKAVDTAIAILRGVRSQLNNE